MNSKEIFIASVVLAVVIIVFGFVKDKKSCCIRIFSRGVAGIFIIVMVNICLEHVEIPLKLGVNYCTICTTALLGIPGLTLLYGVLGIKFL